MNKTFEFKDMQVSVYWNGKTYSDGSRYVTAKHGYQSSNGTYNVNTKTWKKSLGNEAYNKAAAQALGWE